MTKAWSTRHCKFLPFIFTLNIIVLKHPRWKEIIRHCFNDLWLLWLTMYHCKPMLGSSNCTLRLEYNWQDFKVCCSNQSTWERIENKQIIKKQTHKKKRKEKEGKNRHKKKKSTNKKRKEEKVKEERRRNIDIQKESEEKQWQWINEWMNEWTNEGTNKPTGKQMNEKRNEWMNKRKKEGRKKGRIEIRKKCDQMSKCSLK